MWIAYLFGKQAEAMAKYCKKGQQLLADAKLQISNKWNSEQVCSQSMGLCWLIMIVIRVADYNFSGIDLAIDDIGDRYIKFDKLSKHAI